MSQEEFNESDEFEFEFDLEQFIDASDPTDEELEMVKQWLGNEELIDEDEQVIDVDIDLEGEILPEDGIEALKYVEQLNRVAIAKEVNELELQAQRESLEFTRKQQEISLKSLEANLAAHREAIRPSKLAQAVVIYDSMEKKYRAQTVDYSIGMEEMGHTHAISAYGDSPEQALENFDHLWVTGEQR